MSENKTAVRLRIASIVIGIFVVLVGAASAASTLATMAFGSDAAFMAFAPAAAILNPSLFPGNASSTPAVYSATSTPIVPARLLIPAIGVDAKVQQVGKKADGSMGAPSNFTDVAWYALGPEPGQPGSAIIDGHVDNALTTAGVFQHLGELKAGDGIVVEDASSTQLLYTVTSVEDLPADASTTPIFTTSGPSQLVLITCDGDWVNSEHQFDERLVVVASLK